MTEHEVLEGRLNGLLGELVFDSDGYYRGFVSREDKNSNRQIFGPDRILGILLSDGGFQNPDGTDFVNFSGTKRRCADPIQYLLKDITPIRKLGYHKSSLMYD